MGVHLQKHTEYKGGLIVALFKLAVKRYFLDLRVVEPKGEPKAAERRTTDVAAKLV